MAPEISQEPAAPRSTIDGVYLIVTGEVAVPSQLVIFDDDDNERGESPVFTQGMNPRVTNAAVHLTMTGTGGTFTLAAREAGSAIAYHYSDDISYDYTDDEIAATLRQAMPIGSIVDAETTGNVTLLTLRGVAAGRPWTVVRDQTHLTGGTATIASVTTGGQMDYEAGGPYRFGAMVLDENRAVRVDLIAREDGTDSDDNEINEGDVLDTLTLNFA